jgi:thymidine phosphorylase
MDVLSVLRNEMEAPQDLRNKALLLAASIIDMVHGTKNKTGLQLAKEILSSGEAYEKFLAICKAQGGFREPEFALYKEDVKAEKSGIITEIDNRRLAKIAKLAGAPHDSKAGVLLKTPLKTKVQKGDVLYCIYSETKGELKYSIGYMRSEKNIILIQ